MIRLASLALLLSGCVLLFEPPSDTLVSGDGSVAALPDADPLAPDADPLAPDAAPAPDSAPDAAPDADTSESCSSILNQTGCSAGDGCYYKSDGDTGYCHVEGTQTSGQACTMHHDCAAGLLCGEYDRCWAPCSTQPDCGNGFACRDFYSDMKICRPEV